MKQTTWHTHPHRHTAEGITIAENSQGMLISSMVMQKDGSYRTHPHSLSGDRIFAAHRIDLNSEYTSI